MGRHVTNVERLIISIQCVYEEKEKQVQSIISVVQESQSGETESEDELFAVEQVETVNQNRKGQFFVPLSFDHELVAPS